MKIFMFHYVLDKFNYFHFDSNMFEKFIKVYSKDYNFIGLDEFKILYNSHRINEKDNNILVTFDDGTRDHYEYVYKILKKYDAKGLFFIASNVFKKEILDIHKIHLLLSNVDCNLLAEDIRKILVKSSFDGKNNNLIESKYDNNEMRFVKQMLQFALPENIRKDILNLLMKKYDIKMLFEDWYLSIAQIYEMKNYGMDFGLHTKNHKRLELLDREEQELEIQDNLKLLEKNKILSSIKTIAYPFGSYNKETFDILNKNNIEFAFSIDSKYDKNDKFEIERTDANELKKFLEMNKL